MTHRVSPLPPAGRLRLVEHVDIDGRPIARRAAEAGLARPTTHEAAPPLPRRRHRRSSGPLQRSGQASVAAADRGPRAHRRPATGPHVVCPPHHPRSRRQRLPLLRPHDRQMAATAGDLPPPRPRHDRGRTAERTGRSPDAGPATCSTRTWKRSGRSPAAAGGSTAETALENETVATATGLFSRARRCSRLRSTVSGGPRQRRRASRHQRTRPYPPRHDGNVERYQRILAVECLYAHAFRSDDEQCEAISVWVHHCNDLPLRSE